MQCLRIVLYSMCITLKPVLQKNIPALTCPLPFFLVIRKYWGEERG